jgi:hypothetical protein
MSFLLSTNSAMIEVIMKTENQRIIVFAALAFGLNLVFRGFGILFLVVCSIAYSSTLQNKPEMTWHRFAPFFHATWILPLFLTAFFFVASGFLNSVEILAMLPDIGFIKAPLDYISKGMTDNLNQNPEKYLQLYFNPFWRNFYPAARFGFFFGAIPFGAAVAMLVFNNLPVYKSVGGISSRPAFWACLVFFVAFCCLILFTEIAVLPGKFGLTGWFRPVATIVFSWLILLCSAMYAWVLFESRRVTKSEVGSK